MNQNLFIIDDIYKSIIKSNILDIIKDIQKNKTDIIIGNYLFKIFNLEVNQKDEYEIYTYNSESKLSYLDNINKLLKLSNNHICYYDNNFYITKELKDILDLIIKNIDFSDEYKIFLLNKMQKQDYSIYDFIDSCDLDNFVKIANTQIELIKTFNNIIYLPITYCVNKLIHEKSTTIKHILKNMYDILCNLEYEIHPKIFDNKNIDYYDCITNKYNYNDLYDLLNLTITNNNKLFIRCVNIFKLDYKNQDFIYLLKSHINNDILIEILNLLLKNKIYSEEKYLEILLILDKVNYFSSKKTKIDFNKILKYLIKYNSFISFYYLLENYKEELFIPELPIDFLKIYLSLNKENKTINKLINSQLKLSHKNINYLLDNYNKNIIDEEDINFLSEISENIINLSILKKLLNLNNKIKNRLVNNNYLFKLLDLKEEDMFYYFINLFERKEIDKFFVELKDTEGNTLYHYICKNNICLGITINNKLRNNKGFRPLDLCKITHKYYKL